MGARRRFRLGADRSAGRRGWRGALLMLMVFPLLALLLWLPQWRQKHVATVTGAGAA
jgi:CP family cyanate transporter-like MFS transporter